MLLAAKAEVEEVGKERDEVRPGRRSHRSRSVTLSSRVLSTLRLHAAAQVHLSFALPVQQRMHASGRACSSAKRTGLYVYAVLDSLDCIQCFSPSLNTRRAFSIPKARIAPRTCT